MGGALIVFAVMVVNGELMPATVYFVNSPLAIILLLVRSVTFLLGALALTIMTKEYGTGVATTVGTVRKSLTLLFSFVLYPKPFHINYVFGIAAFVGADVMYLHMAGRRVEKQVQGSSTDCPSHTNIDTDDESVQPCCIGTSSSE